MFDNIFVKLISPSDEQDLFLMYLLTLIPKFVKNPDSSINKLMKISLLRYFSQRLLHIFSLYVINLRKNLFT